MEEAEEILQQVFMNCYSDTNSIPVDQLKAYSNYRSEKMSVQKGVAIIGLILFILMPLLFVAPRFTVDNPVSGDRGLPVYTVRISNLLPIYSVTAQQDGYSLPVYQKDKKVFTVEPAFSGDLTITVSLFSHQWTSTVVPVGDTDTKPPVLEGSSMDGDDLYVYVSDADSGVDYRNAYVMDADGNKLYADYYDESQGLIEFDDLSGSGCQIIVPDMIGNELKITIEE